jgi:hypothetical protein
MKNIVIFFAIFLSFATLCESKAQRMMSFIVANGEMPALSKDNNNKVHLVFGNGDSIMYAYSDDNCKTFSRPELIKKLPHVFTFATRGPQVAATGHGILVTACTSEGEIYSFYKENGGSWTEGPKINDVAGVSKEGLMALSAYGNNAWAVWLDLRDNQRNKIYGANSVDGGKTWSRNFMIYNSPDTSVCECCKPSVVVWKNKVAVMFRNRLNGYRDLYVIQSNDGGETFNHAEKLGTGSWKLNACPMDGGNLAINSKGQLQSVWRRETTVYADNPGFHEKAIGKGKGCTVATVNDKYVYAWVENNEVVVLKQDNKKVNLGEGKQPVLESVDLNHFICVWENNKQIYAAVLQL